MDYSAANKELWNMIIQLGLISGVVLISGFLRSRVKFVQKTMMPIAVLGGFLLLGIKYTGLITDSWRCWFIMPSASASSR